MIVLLQIVHRVTLPVKEFRQSVENCPSNGTRCTVSATDSKTPAIFFVQILSTIIRKSLQTTKKSCDGIVHVQTSARQHGHDSNAAAATAWSSPRQHQSLLGALHGSISHCLELTKAAPITAWSSPRQQQPLLGAVQGSISNYFLALSSRLMISRSFSLRFSS